MSTISSHDLFHDLFHKSWHDPSRTMGVHDLPISYVHDLLRMGRRAEGEALWRDVEPLMQAQREQNVTDRYAAALAGHPWAAVP